MEEQSRLYTYAFLSRMFADVLDKKAIAQLRENSDFLTLLGAGSVEFFKTHTDEMIEELANVDYTSVFIIHTHPVESAIFDNSKDIVTGMENPVMQFYLDYGYEVNMNATHIMAPDHMAIEIGFMQNLVRHQDYAVQKKFMQQHIMSWMPPFLIACEEMLDTPLYKELCNFATEFFVSDYAYIETKTAQ
jgi:TorA maturation chaperone TorD